jgi:hypothetical protein
VRDDYAHGHQADATNLATEQNHRGGDKAPADVQAISLLRPSQPSVLKPRLATNLEVSMPFNPKFQSDRISEENDAEAGVRRALGLDVITRRPERSSQYQRTPNQNQGAHSRSGASQAGKVDVVIVQSRRAHGLPVTETHSPKLSSAINRLEQAEATLKSERDAREHIERTLADMQRTIHELQTKLGHAELTAEEARVASHNLQASLQAAELAVETERQARETAEESLRQLRAAQVVAPEPKSEPRPEPSPEPRPEPAALQAPVSKPKQAAPPKAKQPVTPQKAAKVAGATAKKGPKPKMVKWWIKPKDAKKTTG